MEKLQVSFRPLDFHESQIQVRKFFESRIKANDFNLHAGFGVFCFLTFMVRFNSFSFHVGIA